MGGLPVAFVCINGDGFRCTFTVAAGHGQFLRVRTGREVGVPDGALFSQKRFFQPALKILNDRDVRRIRTGGLHHIEGVEVVSPEDIADMLNCLGVAGILPESGVVLPRFPQDDSALLVALNVPCPEDGVSLDIENYCTLRLFFVPLSYVKLDHFDRQL